MSRIARLLSTGERAFAATKAMRERAAQSAAFRVAQITPMPNLRALRAAIAQPKRGYRRALAPAKDFSGRSVTSAKDRRMTIFEKLSKPRPTR